jgi:hypothetical protein
MTGYLIAHIGHTTNCHQHITWWRPNNRGYTVVIDSAGRYSDADAADICKCGSCIAISEDLIKPVVRSTPYYRRHDGLLAPLYDLAGPVVENSRASWAYILANAAFKAARGIDKPTPISAPKARAIYLDGLVIAAQGGAA